MASPKDCWICKGAFAEPWKLAGDSLVVECGTCGPYFLSLSLYSSAPLPDNERFRLSYWNKLRDIEGREPVAMTRYTLPGILASLPDPPTQEKRGILLLALHSRLHPYSGREF